MWAGHAWAYLGRNLVGGTIVTCFTISYFLFKSACFNYMSYKVKYKNKIIIKNKTIIIIITIIN